MSDAEPAGYAAVIPSPHGTFCYGWGITRGDAIWAAKQCWLGMDANARAYMVDRLRLDPLTAEQASEVAEMLDAPW